MHANNETGVIHPVEEIAKIATHAEGLSSFLVYGPNRTGRRTVLKVRNLNPFPYLTLGLGSLPGVYGLSKVGLSLGFWVPFLTVFRVRSLT